jgi:TatA/E family protein of Tat protein translocase
MVFGARRLPELGRSLGSGIKEFKGSLEAGHDAPPEKPAELRP